MQLGQTIINTPKDDKCAFDPAWRYKVAVAWHTEPTAQWSSEYTDYRKDHWIVQQKRYLDMLAQAQAERRDPRLTKDLIDFRQALNWHKARELSKPKFMIEPLLLTPVSFKTIALDIGGEDDVPDTYLTYERLYFNIRTDAGKLHTSSQLRTSFGLPTGRQPNVNTPDEQLWLACATQLGYRALLALRLWPDHNSATEEDSLDYISQDTWRLTQSVLLERALRRGQSDRDMIEHVGKYIDFNRVQKEANAGDASVAETVGMVVALLGASAPHMVKAATKTIDENDAKTAEISARIVSQRQAAGMAAPVVLPASEKSLDNMLASHFKRKGDAG